MKKHRHTKTPKLLGMKLPTKTVMSAIFAVVALSAALILVVVKCYQNQEFDILHFTQIIKHNQRYFILADPYILHNDSMDSNLNSWSAADDNWEGHSAVGFGPFLVTEDTEHQRIKMYYMDGANVRFYQEILAIINRPHRILYDEQSAAFWVIGSHNQEIYKFEIVDNGRTPYLRLVFRKKLDILKGNYIRSITIAEGLMFLAGDVDGQIIAVRYLDDSFAEVMRIPIPPPVRSAHGINDIFVSADGWWYITSTQLPSRDNPEPGGIVRARSLAALRRGEYENVASELGIRKTTPYYLSEFDGRIWLTFVWGDDGILSFRHDADGKIEDVRVFYARVGNR